MTRGFLRAAVILLPFVAGCLQQPVEAPDSAPSLALRGIGAENLVVGGVGLYSQPASFSINVPVAAAGDILDAAFYWSGRGMTSTGDNTIMINGTEYVGTLLDSYELPSGTPWVFFYKLDAAGIVAPGDNTFTIDGFVLDSFRTDGIGLAVIYADDDSPWESVMVLEPNEFIYWGWAWAGLHRTSVLSFPLTPSPVDREARIAIFVTDCEDTRSDEIWWQSGTGTPPTDLIGIGSVTSNQFFSNAGPEIDIFDRDGIPVAADADYIAYQLHSPELGNGDSMAHLFSALCVSRPQSEVGCRVTGGGVDESLEWDGTMEGGSGSGNRYQFGGQAGAPTGAQPQPYGEWTHHQQRGDDGSFVFHAGTASAPPGTEIDRIACSDPGWCRQARPAPAKQIDFEGVGTFRTIRRPSAPLEHVVPGETFHWFDVHIEDLGEPGNGRFRIPEACPPGGSEGSLADCDCPDFYRITIYRGVGPGEPPNKTDVIYDVWGYINGNLQIHPSLD